MASRSEWKRAKLERREFVNAISSERDLKNNILSFKEKTHYTNIKMRITEGPKDKIKKAFESNSKSITIRFKYSDLYGEDVIALIKSQVGGLVEAYEENNGLTIRMSTTQLSHNAKIEGGFLPA